MIAIGNKEVSHNSAFEWVVFNDLNPQGDGSLTASYADKTVLSVQKDGSWETRPEGSNGLFERFFVQGNMITFNCFGAVHVFPFVNMPS